MPMVTLGKLSRGSRPLGAIGLYGLGQSGEVPIESTPGVPTDIFTPPFVPYGPTAPAPSTGINWGSVLTTGINTATNTTAQILKAQYGGLQPGQYVAQGPGGTVAYTLPKGSAQVGVTAFPGFDTGSLGTWLLIGGALVVGVMLLKGGRR